MGLASFAASLRVRMFCNCWRLRGLEARSRHPHTAHSTRRMASLVGETVRVVAHVENIHVGRTGMAIAHGERDGQVFIKIFFGEGPHLWVSSSDLQVVPDDVPDPMATGFSELECEDLAKVLHGVLSVVNTHRAVKEWRPILSECVPFLSYLSAESARGLLMAGMEQEVASAAALAKVVVDEIQAKGLPVLKAAFNCPACGMPVLIHEDFDRFFLPSSVDGAAVFAGCVCGAALHVRRSTCKVPPFPACATIEVEWQNRSLLPAHPGPATGEIPPVCGRRAADMLRQTVLLTGAPSPEAEVQDSFARMPDATAAGLLNEIVAVAEVGNDPRQLRAGIPARMSNRLVWASPNLEDAFCVVCGGKVALGWTEESIGRTVAESNHVCGKPGEMPHPATITVARTWFGNAEVMRVTYLAPMECDGPAARATPRAGGGAVGGRGRGRRC